MLDGYLAHILPCSLAKISAWLKSIALLLLAYEVCHSTEWSEDIQVTKLVKETKKETSTSKTCLGGIWSQAFRGLEIEMEFIKENSRETYLAMDLKSN